MTIEFKEWPKIPRLYRQCVITEKLDGTNSAVGIVPLEELQEPGVSYTSVDAMIQNQPYTALVTAANGLPHTYVVYAQSRKRIIRPSALTGDKSSDNYGFAAWVADNAHELVTALGAGLHYGEWWGSGIARGYGLLNGEKRFSLFNTERYKDVDFSALPNVGLVPVLYRGIFNTHTVDHRVEILRASGSAAVPGYMRPEGVITYHVASGVAFKTTLDNDEKPKGSNEPG